MRTSRNQLIDAEKVLRRLSLQEGRVMADLGCGALGHFIFPAAAIVGHEGKVYAVDIDKTALHSIERMSLETQQYQIQTVWSDIDIVGATRIPEGTVHLTLIANNLYLSSDRHGLITEAIRLTAPGGTICIIEWKTGERPIGPAKDARMSESGVKTLFLQTECSFIESFDAGDEHYALVYVKNRAATRLELESLAQPLVLTPAV